MNKLLWLLVGLVCKPLDSQERDAVLGDFEESRQSAAQSLGDAVGLLVRRQFAVWQGWRPWLALVGIAGIAAVPLSQLNSSVVFSVWQQWRTYRHYGVLYETGLTSSEELAHIVCLSLAVFLFSWTSSFVLASLSGRASWLTGALFYAVVMESAWIEALLSGDVASQSAVSVPLFLLRHLLPWNPQAMFFLIAIAWGTRQGLRPEAPRVSPAIVLFASAITLTALLAWMHGWYDAVHQAWSGGFWHPDPWYTNLSPLLPMSWPACYLLFIATQNSRRQSRSWRPEQ